MGFEEEMNLGQISNNFFQQLFPAIRVVENTCMLSISGGKHQDKWETGRSFGVEPNRAHNERQEIDFINSDNVEKCGFQSFVLVPEIHF